MGCAATAEQGQRLRGSKVGAASLVGLREPEGHGTTNADVAGVLSSSMGTLGRASDYASHCKSSVLNYFSYYALETIVWGARVIIINRNDYFAEVDRQRRNVITADALYAISEGSTEDFKKGNS